MTDGSSESYPLISCIQFRVERLSYSIELGRMVRYKIFLDLARSCLADGIILGLGHHLMQLDKCLDGGKV